METTKRQYSIGDWVVHSNYGVGQIKALEKKSLSGDLEKKEDCFQVRTRESTFWFSAIDNDNSRIRPTTSKNQLRRDISILKMPPKFAGQDWTILKQQISEARSDMSIATTLFIVRELFALRARKNLGMNDERMLSDYSDRLADEYALVMDIDAEIAWSQLCHLMRESDPEISGS